MLPELLGRDKQPGCLSGLQISLAALNLLDDAGQAHRRSCEVCAARVQQEDKERHAALYERVPLELLARVGSPPWWRRLQPSRQVMVFLLGAGILLVTLPLLWTWWRAKPAPVSVLIASVSRGGQPMQEEVAVRQLGRLAGGDGVRLRVRDSKVRWVRLRSPAETFFEGPVPQDGWLPARMTVDRAGRIPLHVLACPGEPAVGAGPVPTECVVEEFVLGG